MGNPPREISEALRRAACESLENLAFTEVDLREDSRLSGTGGRYLGSRIGLGTLGNLHMVILGDFLKEIAGVLFNSDPESLDGDLMRDAQLEILNIIAGRFLEGVFQDKSDFMMGLPEPHLDLEAWNSLPVRLVLVGEGGKEIGIGLGPG